MQLVRHPRALCPTNLGLLAALALSIPLAAPARAYQCPTEYDVPIELEWWSWHATTKSAYETALAVGMKSGGAYATGRTRAMNSSAGRWLTVRHDLVTGVETWRAFHPSESAHGQEAVDLAFASDRLFVAGKLSETSGWSSNLGLLSYASADGSLLWSSEWGGAGPDWPTAVAATPDPSAVFVVGGTGQDLLVQGRAQADGALLWSKTYDGGKNDVARDAVCSPDSSTLFVTGWSEVGSQGGGALLAYRANDGALLWSLQEAADIYVAELRSIALAPNGSRVYVAGDLGGNDDVICYAASDGTRLWSAPFDSVAPWLGAAADLAVSADGSRLFVTGTASAAAGDGDLRTICFDSASGAVLWSKDWDAPAPGPDEERGAALAFCSCMNSLHVTGTTTTASGDLDWVTVAYDVATGAEKWSRQLGGVGQADDEPHGIAAGSARVLLGGSFDLGKQEGNLALRSLWASTGADDWDADLDVQVAASDLLADLAETPDGSLVFATGEACCGQGAEIYAIDAQFGNEIWSVSPDLNGQSRGESIAADPSGDSVYAAGKVDDARFLIKHQRNTGNELWRSTLLGTPWSSTGTIDICVAPGGVRLYTTAAVGLEAGMTHDYSTSAWDPASGLSIWTQVHDGKAEFDEPVAIVAAADGSRVFVTGTSAPTTYTDVFGYTWPDLDFGTVAYNAVNGTRHWTSYYHGTTNNTYEIARDIAVAPDSETVVVTGLAETDTLDDFVTVAYETNSGLELWNMRFDAGGTRDDPSALAIDPLGQRVYVTGYSDTGVGQARNFATVAYDLATGVELWRDVRSSPTDDLPVDLVVDTNGSRVELVGSRRDASGSGPGTDFLIVVLDAATGSTIGTTDFTVAGPPDQEDYPTALLRAHNSRRFYVGGSSVEFGKSDSDAVVLSYYVPRFSADVTSISAAAGGSQTLALVADAKDAGRPYLVLGSLSTPCYGIPVDLAELPLGLDSYLWFSFDHANQPPYASTFGTLDGSGLATASIHLPPGMASALAGIQFHHAYLVFELPGRGIAVLASNPVPLLLMP